jgi:hypothetical protein
LSPYTSHKYFCKPFPDVCMTLADFDSRFIVFTA